MDVSGQKGELEDEHTVIDSASFVPGDLSPPTLGVSREGDRTVVVPLLRVEKGTESSLHYDTRGETSWVRNDIKGTQRLPPDYFSPTHLSFLECNGKEPLIRLDRESFLTFSRTRSKVKMT